ncbi:MAG: SurA N-terminal domain-containing protein [Elusimicrobia bacterium]|nr:SurA N-terminal domain-containing protein [Elusimicrobiota bacterium]
MMDFLRKHRHIIFTVTIIGFLGGAFIGFGSYFFGGKTTSDNVVVVNGVGIPYRNYVKLLNRAIEFMHQQKQEVNAETTENKKKEVLQDLIQEEVFWQQAAAYGISVSDEELSANIQQQYPAFQKDGHFDRMTYFQVLAQSIKMTPKEFEDSRRKQITNAKVRQLIASSVKISEPELQIEYARVHRGSMADFDKNREIFLKQTLQEKTMMVFNEWYKYLNQTMKIKAYLSEIEKQP